MPLLGLLMPVLGLVAIVAFIWLLVIAFRQSVWWGIAVLFLSPISLVIFAIKHWNESKKPFLIYSSCVLGMIGIVAAAFGAIAGMLMGASAEAAREMAEAQKPTTLIEDTVEPGERPAALAEADREELDRLRQGLRAASEGPEEQPADEEPEPAVRTVTSTETSGLIGNANAMLAAMSGQDSLPPIDAELGPRGFDKIEPAQAHRHIGQTVRLEDRDGGQHTGRLISVRSNVLFFERQVAGGTFSYDLPASEIAKLYVLRAEP